jgi:hypothetical protein
VAGAFGVGNEADEQHALVGTVRRVWTKLVAPEAECLPRAQLVRREADNVGPFARSGNKFEVVQPNLVEKR